MKFKEILESGVGLYLFTELYEQAGIEVIDNSPEEIAAVSIEMDERLQGTWQSAEEDDDLQRRLWSHFENSKQNDVVLSRMGATFLRENRDLLD